MSFRFHIENFGKLSDATIDIGRFTVLAGQDNTGKSFASKALYSILSAANEDLLGVYLRENLKALYLAVKSAQATEQDNVLPEDDPDSFSFAMERAVRSMHNGIRGIFAKDGVEEADAIEAVRPIAHQFLAEINRIFPKLSEHAEVRPLPLEMSYLPLIKNIVHELSYITAHKDHFVNLSGVSRKVTHNLHGNFQVDRLSKIISDGAEEASFGIEGNGNFRINRDGMMETVTSESLQVLKKFSRIIYLESPVLWKLSDALKDCKISAETSNNIPKYFLDLSGMLQRRFSGEPICPKVLEHLTSDEVMSGKVVMSETGMLFQENSGSTREMPLAATGVANLGVLAFLIERRILDKNACLFIDGPESNLHPAWQVEMVDALFSLAQAGVNVVIATHSVEIIKYLQVRVKKNPQGNFIALNHFRGGSVSPRNKDSLEDRLTDVILDLAAPYRHMYYEGMT